MACQFFSVLGFCELFLVDVENFAQLRFVLRHHGRIRLPVLEYQLGYSVRRRHRRRVVMMALHFDARWYDRRFLWVVGDQLGSLAGEVADQVLSDDPRGILSNTLNAVE